MSVQGDSANISTGGCKRIIRLPANLTRYPIKLDGHAKQQIQTLNFAQQGIQDQGHRTATYLEYELCKFQEKLDYSWSSWPGTALLT